MKKVLRFKDNSIPLETQSLKFTQEVYKSSRIKSNEMDFVGSVSHSLTIQFAQAAAAGVDKAIEQLQQSMSKYEQEKEAKK